MAGPYSCTVQEQSTTTTTTTTNGIGTTSITELNPDLLRLVLLLSGVLVLAILCFVVGRRKPK